MWKILYFCPRVIYLIYINLHFMNISRISSILLITLSTILFAPIASYAACDDPGQSPCEESVPVTPVTTQTPWQDWSDNILGISTERLRNGDITIADIPLMIVSIIQFLLGLAGSISVVALIYHAVKMQLASGITGDSSWVDKSKKWMKWALLGFVVSMSAWFLMTKFIELLSSNT